MSWLLGVIKVLQQRHWFGLLDTLLHLEKACALVPRDGGLHILTASPRLELEVYYAVTGEHGSVDESSFPA
jgi:hypothetical protein